MKDITQAKVVCPNCNKQTSPGLEMRSGFRLRLFQCPSCKDKFYNPKDLKEFEEFKTLNQRQFNVKLRMVGNSFSVTIPREIIEFEEKFRQMEEHMNKMMSLSLEEPGKVSLYFKQIRIQHPKEEEENG